MPKRFLIFSVFLAGFALFLVAPAAKTPVLVFPSKLPPPIKVWSGVASWYGFDFQGQATASGQPFDGMLATAAHPWLPFGSLLRLTDLTTGRSQLVRVNDRGPFVDDRDLDVSYIVAQRLGFLAQGVARLQIELLREPPRQ